MRVAFFLLLIFILSACVQRGDSLNPVVNITSPANGTVSSSDQLAIVGFAMDDEGIRAIRVNGSDILQSEQLRAERGKKLIEFGFRPSRIQEGEFGATIIVEDMNGRTKELPYTLSIDATPPTLKVIAPSEENGMLRIIGAARDNQALGSIMVNGVEVTFSAGKEKIFTVDVEPAEEIRIVVQDQAGNQAQRVLIP